MCNCRARGWPVASALSLTVCVTALHVQGECRLWPCFQAECPVAVRPGPTLGGHMWGQLLACPPNHITSQAGWLRLDPTGEGEASSGAGGPRVPAPPPPCPCCCRLTVLETASEEGTGLVEGLYHSPFYQGELSLRQEANTDTLRLPGGMC